MPIPPCEDAPYSYFYPVIITQMPGKTYYDIGSESYYPSIHENFAPAGQLSKFQQKFRPRYGNLHFCYFPHPDFDEKKTYFIGMEDPLPKNLGTAKPYPVLFCKDSQYLRRVVMVPNRNGTAYVPETAYYTEPNGDMERPLTVQEMAMYEDYFFEEEGGVGYCQREFSKDPAQYVLYWAYNRNARIFDECRPSKESVNYISGLLETINDFVISKYREALNPYVVSMASEVASEISSYAGFLFLPDKQDFLEEIVACALHYDVSLEDLFAIAIDCANNSQTEDEFLSSMATVICLRMTDALNKEHVARGGLPISPDIADILYKVEEVIRDGRLEIKVENIGAQDDNYVKMRGAGIVGIYYSDKNQLIFQPLSAKASFFSMINGRNIIFNFLLHECVHVYQDIMKMDIVDLEAERQAYNIDVKAHMLLRGSLGEALTEMDQDFIDYEFKSLEAYQVQTVISGMECMNYNNRAMDLFREYRLGKSDLTIEWIDELKWEFYSDVPSMAQEIFADLYREKHLYTLMNRNLEFLHAYVSEHFIEQDSVGDGEGVCPIEISDWMRSNEKILREARTAYMLYPEATPQGSQAAVDYMNGLGHMLVYSYYLDPALFDELYNEFLEEFDNLSAGIIYYSIERDGI